MKPFSTASSFRGRLATLACGGLLALTVSGAYAGPTITNLDGSFSPFGGFDWSKAGNAITSGAIINGGTVTSIFWANAIAVVNTASVPFLMPGLDPPGTLYEYTAFATITETVSCAGAPGDPCGANATFTATGGSWDVYYDTAPNANLVTGAGITDGAKLIEGNVTSGGGLFSLFGGGGIGVFDYMGNVTYTNSAYINPDLDTSTAVATLQFGNTTTNWTPPSSEPAAGGGTQPIPPGSLSFQADGNQSFTARTVPEPATLLLLGGALLGLGIVVRKQSKA